MKLTAIKQNLAKYAKAHQGDLLVLVKVKQQIARAVTDPAQYAELVRYYIAKAKL